MEKQVNQEHNFLAWIAQELGEIRPFKPIAWYDKNFDWFICMGQDASYTELTTTSLHLELFKDNTSGKIIGFKVLEFSCLPNELRSAFLATIDDHEDIGNIEDIWLMNMREMAPDIAAEEEKFFKELKARGGLDDEERAMLEELFARSSKGFFG